MSTLVDAHHHLWDPSAVATTLFDRYPRLAPIIPLGSLAAYDAMARAHGIDAAACVEAASAAGDGPAETAWLIEQARSSPLPRVLVAWAPLEEAGVGAWLGGLAASPVPVTGVRRSFEAVPDGFLGRPEVIAGLEAVGAAGLCFDLVLFSPRLAEATELVRRLPQVRFVLDHLGKPPLEPGSLRAWAVDLRALAARPNVVAKLSGLLTESVPGSDPDGAVRSMIAVALEAFGPDRLMVGTDWPEC
jgi:L-fuconolactonase